MVFITLFWWIPAIFTSLFQACYHTANQFYKLDGTVAAFWRGLLCFIILAPTIFFLPFPKEPLFYISTFIASVLGVYIDIRILDAAKDFGGGIITRILSLAPIITFFVWFGFKPGLIATYFSQPLLSLGLLSIIVLVILVLLRLRTCEYNRKALLSLFPVLICIGVAPLFNKNAMDHSPVLSGVLYYIWLQGGIIALFSFITMILRGEVSNISMGFSLVFQKQNLYYGTIIALFALFLLGTKSFAFSLVEHPVYVSIVQRLSAIWVILFYRLIQHEEKGDVRSGLVLVLLAVLFIAIESQIKY